jgi:hypothetical protein
VFHPVPFEISHWVGNENQDTIALLENCADVDKKGGRDSQKQRAS